MAGFQKYPVPRYLHTYKWLINSKWKANSLHALAGGILFTLVWYRHLELLTVIN